MNDSATQLAPFVGKIPNTIKVKSRYKPGIFYISLSSYLYIKDIVDFYHDSIYSFSDHEKVDAYFVRPQFEGFQKCTLKINELII
jgi:hypothetical protein